MVPVFAIWFVQAKRRRTSRGEGVSFRGILVLAVRGYAARRNVNIMPAPVGGSGDSLSRYQNSTILPAILRFSSIAFAHSGWCGLAIAAIHAGVGRAQTAQRLVDVAVGSVDKLLHGLCGTACSVAAMVRTEVPARRNRSMLNASIGVAVRPSSASSASTAPTAGPS